MYQPANPPRLMYRRRAAIAIAGTTLLALAALSHHPVASHADSVQQTLMQLAALQRMNGVVHGGLIVLLGVLAAGFAVFSTTLGIRRPAVLFAATAYGLGCCSMVAAMLFDGFVIPQLARALIAPPATGADAALALMRAIGVAVQVLTKAGFLSMCIALGAWSHALCTGHRISYWASWCAAIGAGAALLPSAYILFADVRLAPASLMAIFAIHAVWNLAAALVLYAPPQVLR
jgi:hypothetical protein